MEQVAVGVVGWLAPILSTLIITAATAMINRRIAERDRIADERHAETESKRAEEAAWRERIEKRLDEQDGKISSVLDAQCTQMRSDLIHRAHRYVDDLGAASTEEKQAFWAQYEDYLRICESHGIKNNFIDQLVEQVMGLPTREFRQSF